MLFKDGGATGGAQFAQLQIGTCSSVERAGPTKQPAMGSCGFWQRHLLSKLLEAQFYNSTRFL
jgi:hypothetical protein